jgi:hypothetical protein
MTFICHIAEPLPFELVEQFIAEAMERLPPVQQAGVALVAA